MITVNEHIFRQYDIRGVAERDLTDDVVTQLGKALGTVAIQNGSYKVLVGRDNRLSSERLRDALVKGLMYVGCDVVDIGLVVTPVLYYARVQFGINAAVMITGSHNPPDENGFKIALSDGTIYGDDIRKLKELMLAGEFSAASGSLERIDAITPYLNMLMEKILAKEALKEFPEVKDFEWEH